jgi:hypothetical protein
MLSEALTLAVIIHPHLDDASGTGIGAHVIHVCVVHLQPRFIYTSIVKNWSMGISSDFPKMRGAFSPAFIVCYPHRLFN